ncbi:pyroglutamyl-peptidase I family protein [Mesorhizobium xinjiangense]|uniref:pyroglutamyl-peptidase I family protein n=1 Tax=Mesorhizobium xinjiangense TaxID=2678685 RepID=UPI0012ED50AD|nr:pyroglutamyl-peptidase I [Mesorhizobium xinjiangense]
MARPQANASPRVLVTGFEPFPGAPVNPTEALVSRLRQSPPAIDGMGAFRAEVLPVDYAAVGPRLSQIGREFSPDIAIHFGLALECGGFRLERLARNRFAADRPDNTGELKAEGAICRGPGLLPSNLPLPEIFDRLTATRLPVEWSDDAGGYLCNMVFTLSRTHACEDFTPAMSGFIHVPLTGTEPASSLNDAQLAAGAAAIVSACCAAWHKGD